MDNTRQRLESAEAILNAIKEHNYSLSTGHVGDLTAHFDKYTKPEPDKELREKVQRFVTSGERTFGFPEDSFRLFKEIFKDLLATEEHNQAERDRGAVEALLKVCELWDAGDYPNILSVISSLKHQYEAGK